MELVSWLVSYYQVIIWNRVVDVIPFVRVTGFVVLEESTEGVRPYRLLPRDRENMRDSALSVGMFPGFARSSFW